MKIRKNGTVLDVTKGAYDALFADMGYTPEKSGKGTRNRANKQNGTTFMSAQPEEPKEPEKPTPEDVPFGNMINQEDEDDDDYEVVLSEMTVKELIEYADENDIDLDGATRKDDIISAIEEAMEE